ncbi:hypothetical protein HPY42_01760 [Coprothermobacteraceae bacterium]|nr:hypothetical protein [Coprothermobacteraceae bacterium]
MEGITVLLGRYSAILDQVCDSISHSRFDEVSRYVVALEDIISLIAQYIQDHPEEKSKYGAQVQEIHEKQQKILALLDAEAQKLANEAQNATTTYQARRVYEQNKEMR